MKFQHPSHKTILIGIFTLIVAGTSLFCSKVNAAEKPSTASQNQIRDYYKPLTKQDREDIEKIVTSLAKYTWTELLSHRSSIKKAGDRVDTVHPLKFLECIFTNEKLKAGIHSIRERSKIWSEFSGGLFKSLETESKRNNLTAEQIADFSNALGIDSSKITGSIKKRNWTELFDILMELLPRTGNPGRYDM